MDMPRNIVLTQPPTSLADNYPSLASADDFRAYFEREGFVVLRSAVSPELCEAAKQSFLTEMLPAKKAYFLRHASGRHERHVYTEQGFMKYPIMNFQDISTRRYAKFKKISLDLLTHDVIKRVVCILLGEPGQIVHTMYFDGNQTTWAHRDGHYFDSNQAGQMVGVWIAAEDIHPEAGRFFVIPRSHRTPVPGEEHDPNGTEYKAIMADFVRSGPLDCVAPVLKQGDMLVWNSMTIHGSLPTTNPHFSRRSFTAHYVPQSHQLKRHVAKGPQLQTMLQNGVTISLYSDHRSAMGIVKNSLRSEFPGLYRIAQQIKMAMATTFAARSVD